MREGWQRLKYLVDINSRDLDENTDPSFEFRYVDIGSVGRGILLEEPERMSFADAPSRARRLVQSGDTIVSTVRTYLRAIWPVQGETAEMVVSTGFAVLTPRPELDARYLGWIAQSDVVIDEIVARSVGVSYPAINGLEIGDVAVPVPPIPIQRNIADYLGAETARIDRLVEARRHQLRVLPERLAALVAELVSLIQRESLGHCLMSVEQGWSPTADEAVRDNDDQWAVLKLSAVTGGTFRPNEHKTLPSSPGTYSRYEVRAGDLLMTRANTPELVGDAVFVDFAPSRLLIPDLVYRLRYSPQRASGRYLGYVLRTDEVRGQLGRNCTRHEPVDGKDQRRGHSRHPDPAARCPRPGEDRRDPG